MSISKAALALRSRKCSNCFSRTVLNEVRRAVYGRSYGSSAPCEVPQSPRTQRKVTRDERRAMVESFVNKYRSTNERKFPPVRAVKKEVRGDFYVVRTILQELKQKSKAFISREDAESWSKYEVISSRAKSLEDEASPLKKDYEKCDDHVEPDRGSQFHVPSGRDTLDVAVESNTQAENADRVEKQSSQVGGVKIDASESSHKETKGVRKKGKRFENIKTRKRIANTMAAEFRIEDLDRNQRRSEKSKTSDVQELERDQPFEMSETDFDEKAISGELPESESPESKTEESQGSTPAKKDSRDISERQANDAEVAKRPNLWGNLKSFADGIINMWRKW